MNHTHLANPVLPLLACLALAGCATPPPPPPAPNSYVVVLPNADGSVGKVSVTGPQGTTVLQNAGEATRIALAGGPGFVATAEQIARDFGPAMAGSPKIPVQFSLYFVSGEANLTAQSKGDLEKVLAEVATREVPEVAIIGHTDTTGDAALNEKLGLERAKLVATMLSSPHLNANNVTVESHGENNLLIPTADNVPEPRNRRVEVTVR